MANHPPVRRAPETLRAAERGAGLPPGVRRHDPLDVLAGLLWDAYQLDTRDPEPWPPSSASRYRAWRRAAAAAHDLGARP